MVSLRTQQGTADESSRSGPESHNRFDDSRFGPFNPVNLFEEIKTHKGRQPGRPFYKDARNGLLYQEFAGGFSWPEAQPPFICVVGWEHKKNVIRVLYEGHEATMVDLARQLGVLQTLYHLSDWSAEIEASKKGFGDLLCETGDMEGLSFTVVQPSLPTDIYLAREVLARQVRANALVLIKAGILQEKIEQLNQADLTQPGLIERFPEVLVLARLVHESGGAITHSLPPGASAYRPGG